MPLITWSSETGSVVRRGGHVVHLQSYVEGVALDERHAEAWLRVLTYFEGDGATYFILASALPLYSLLVLGPDLANAELYCSAVIGGTNVERRVAESYVFYGGQAQTFHLRRLLPTSVAYGLDVGLDLWHEHLRIGLIIAPEWGHPAFSRLLPVFLL